MVNAELKDSRETEGNVALPGSPRDQAALRLVTLLAYRFFEESSDGLPLRLGRGDKFEAVQFLLAIQDACFE